MTGLGEQLLSAIRDIQGADASELALDDMSTATDADAMDWEDVPLPEQPQDDHNTFAYAARDLMDERFVFVFAFCLCDVLYYIQVPWLCLSRWAHMEAANSAAPC